MKIFCSFRTLDKLEAEKIVSELNDRQQDYRFITHTTLEPNDEIWKQKVSEKIKDSFATIFFIGKKTNQSEAINWELDEALKLKKKRIVIFLNKNALTLPGFFTNSVTVIEKDIDKILEEIKNTSKLEEREFNLLLEQYKIMVSSTEKVTTQRLTVNNLFFTITAAVLSASFLLLKDLEFNFGSLLILISSFIMAFVMTKFWKKMVCSYGLLNKGKFMVIAELEDKLKINLFQNEWKILLEQIKYESNTSTETKIVERFRIFIICIGILELVYFILKNLDKLKALFNQ